jgi:hypothetical protein
MPIRVTIYLANQHLTGCISGNKNINIYKRLQCHRSCNSPGGAVWCGKYVWITGILFFLIRIEASRRHSPPENGGSSTSEVPIFSETRVKSRLDPNPSLILLIKKFPLPEHQKLLKIFWLFQLIKALLGIWQKTSRINWKLHDNSQAEKNQWVTVCEFRPIAIAFWIIKW